MNKPTDYGAEPIVVNIAAYTLQNTAFRTALWTGEHLQVTVMSIDVGDDIGLEQHNELDQFLFIVQGTGRVMMGETADDLDFRVDVTKNAATIVPAGQWHNLMNTGDIPLKLFSIYAPPTHPFGTVQQTKEEAQKAEE